VFLCLKKEAEATSDGHVFNPLNAELNPIRHLLALLDAHHIFHVSGLRVKSYTVEEVHKKNEKGIVSVNHSHC